MDAANLRATSSRYAADALTGDRSNRHRNELMRHRAPHITATTEFPLLDHKTRKVASTQNRRIGLPAAGPGTDRRAFHFFATINRRRLPGRYHQYRRPQGSCRRNQRLSSVRFPCARSRCNSLIGATRFPLRQRDSSVTLPGHSFDSRPLPGGH
jgi:hypothetical protein